MEQVVGNWDQRKDVENDENMTECARSAVMLDREISPNLFKVYINDMLLIVALEATKQGVTVGEDTVSGLIFADDFVGYWKHPKECRNKSRRH